MRRAMVEPGASKASNNPGSAEVPRTSRETLSTFAQRVLEAAGLPPQEAQLVAHLMVEADLRGSDTHGVVRLPLYIKRLQAGGINARPAIRTIRDMPAAALVDGDNGMGHLVMHYAARLAIAKAKAAGVAWVGARMSNH